jgi:hypothetical protein
LWVSALTLHLLLNPATAMHPAAERKSGMGRFTTMGADRTSRVTMNQRGSIAFAAGAFASAKDRQSGAGGMMGFGDAALAASNTVRAGRVMRLC